MTTRDRYRKLLERLGAIDAEVDARENEPVADFTRLTAAELAVFDALTAEIERNEAEGCDALAARVRLSYDQLCQLRALERKALGLFVETPIFNSDHENFRDTAILAAINRTAAA